jgi:hypothetical protein
MARSSAHQLESQHAQAIEGAHRQHVFAQLLGYFAHRIVGLIALADEDGEAHAANLQDEVATSYDERRCNRALCSPRAQQEAESCSLHGAHQRPVLRLVLHGERRGS